MLASSISQGSGAGWPGVLLRGPTWLTARLWMSSDLRLLILSDRWCNRRQLESLIGHLHHAAKVVWPGRTFWRRMLDLLCCFHTRDHPIRLSSGFRLDLQWWHDFLTSWHGASLGLFPGMSAPRDVEVTSDAAGSLGSRVYYNNEWFSGA